MGKGQPLSSPRMGKQEVWHTKPTFLFFCFSLLVVFMGSHFTVMTSLELTVQAWPQTQQTFTCLHSKS